VACGFRLFCFAYNNFERLFAAMLAQGYYAFIYIFWDFKAVADFLKGPGSAAAAMLLLAAAFMAKDGRAHDDGAKKVFPAGSGVIPARGEADQAVRGKSGRDGKADTAALTLIGVDAIYYIIMLMTLYIEYDEQRVIGSLYGIGGFVAVAAVLAVQLWLNRSALHIWNLFLALTVLGLAGLLADSDFLLNAGSFLYGSGEGMGYIVLLYMLGGAVKRSGSYKVFRLYCLVTFIEYFAVTLGFDALYANVALPNHYVAFAVIVVLACACVAAAPSLQKRLFDADWTDGFHLADMPEYREAIAETAKIEKRDALKLTPREREIFSLLLTDIAPKAILAELKISRGTLNTHSTNLYRKLGIQSRAELFAKYGRAAAWDA
jgi:DNA-binding CsgD family transcriptional regulator